MKIDIRDGWLPRALLYGEDSPIVELVRVDKASINSVFLHLDLQDVKEVVRKPLREIGYDPAIKPAGFIFHLSRCGSSVMTQMLHSVRSCRVISESGALIDACQFPGSSQEEVIEWIKILTSIFHYALCDDGQKLLIKFSSWQIFYLSAIQQAFPDVPGVFITRDPVEVMVSLLKNKPGWMKWDQIQFGLRSDDPLINAYSSEVVRLALDGNEEDIASVPEEEICARILGKYCEAVLNAAEPLSTILYRDIPDIVVSSVCELFELHPDQREINAMLDVAKYDAKTGKKCVRKFKSDTENKQQNASGKIREISARLISPAMEIVNKKAVRSLKHD